MAKYESVDDLRNHREELADKYDGNLPAYLEDFFDEEENKHIKSEFFKERAIRKYKATPEERREFIKGKEEEFWEDNEFEIVKKKKTVRDSVEPIYEEPLRNEEILEEERDLTKDEIRILKSICERDLYLFAIRYFKHYLKKPSSKLHKFLYDTISREFNKNRIKGFKRAVAAPRANAKCEKHDNIINKLDGSLVKISDIKVGDSILSLNNKYKVEPDIVVAKTYSGKKLVRDVKLKSGRKTSVTDDHRLFNIHGEIKVGDLKIGDKIATPRKLDCITKKDTMSSDEAKFLSYMIAEGSLSSGNCNFVNFDKVVVDEFLETCNNLGFKVSDKSRLDHYNLSKGINAPRKYLRKHSLYGSKSTDKLIPDIVFEQSDNFLKVFLSRFIDTDGWIAVDNPTAGITLANKKLIDQLFIIFLRLGLLPTIQCKPNDKAGAWAVVIHGTHQLIRLSEIGIRLKQQKLLNTIERFKYRKHNPNVDTVDKEWKQYLRNTTPHFLRKNHNIRVDNNCNTSRNKLSKVANIDNNSHLRNLAYSDVFWDEIVEISESYLTDTYDIETYKNHNFVSNNIFSHNSTIISTILPLWCIAYNKKSFIIVVSDTVGQASDYLSDMKRELELNVLLLRDFPHIIGKGPIWRNDEIITNNNIKILALGTGSKIRGRKFGTHRPDLLIFDDLEGPDMVRSESEREFIRYQWFNKDAMHVGGEEGTCTDMLVVGTILGKDALLNAILDPSQYPDWQGYRFKAVLSFSDSDLWNEWEVLYKDKFDENREETARKFFEDHEKEMLGGTRVLWPEGDPYYSLMIDKISDYSGFLSEKQSDPLDPSKILVLHEELRFENFITNPRITDILRNKNNPIYGALDPSLGKKAGAGDYSCIVTLLRDTKTGLLLVIHIDLKRRKVDDQIEAIIRSHKRWKYALFGVETNAFQLVVADNLRKISKREGVYVPIKDMENYRDKKLRVESIVPLLKDGTIIFDSALYNSNQQYRMGVEQLTTFTGDGDRHDDMPDCLEMTVRIASERKFVRRTKQNR